MKRKPTESPQPFHLQAHHITLREWFEKDKHRMPTDSLVCDPDPSRNWVVCRGKFTPVLDRPSESPAAIRNWTTERAEKEIDDFWESDRTIIANLIERAKIRKPSLDSLAMKSEVLLNAIFSLAEEDGSSTQSFAAHKLLWTLNSYVAKLNGLARRKPDLFRPIARKFFKWPLLKSTHPHLSDSDALLETLQLGKEVGFPVDKFSKWKPDKAMEIAFELKNYQDMLRINHHGFHPIKVQRLFQKLPFTAANAPELWALAKYSLLSTYPHPGAIPEFCEIGISPSKRKTVKSRDKAILEKIESRFIHLAGVAPWKKPNC